ncbi:galactose-3-O-sulfotransferase 4 [Carettochelys insculpta]|uniref:galactose-3-O-sulfotransferase 4 n=1 Tax=Carettochelys insculpta TaxID=44489 RepID=UPI003EB73E11
MKLPLGCCRLQVLAAALGVCMTIGFALQLLGMPFQQRRPPAELAPRRAPPRTAALEEEGSRQPRCHIVFLKTHKTGGSTIVNLLHRYGESRGLRFALPHRYQFGYPQPFQAQRVRGYRPGGPPFDILCHHMRFNPPEVEKVMAPDSFYFSIVREPAALAESAFAYYRAVAPAFRRAGTLARFLEAPERYYDPAERGNHYARNLLWFDFGLPPPPPRPGPEEVQAALAGLERRFSLVLLAEHFDESLVLLREALGWAEADADAFRHNGRSPRAVTRLAPDQAARLRAWNDLDGELYAHFNRSFWRRVEAFGPGRLRDEVARLRERRRALAGLCLQGGGPVEAAEIPDRAMRPFQLGQAPILGYALRSGLGPAERLLCTRLVTPELQYKDALDARQFGANISAGPAPAVGGR